MKRQAFPLAPRGGLGLHGDVRVRVAEPFREIHLLPPPAGRGDRSRGSQLPPLDVHGMPRRMRRAGKDAGRPAGQARGDPGASRERRRVVRPRAILPVPPPSSGEAPEPHGPGRREASAHLLGGRLLPGGGSSQGVPGEGPEEPLPVRADDRLPFPARRRHVRKARDRAASRIRGVLPRRRKGGERPPVRRKGPSPLPDRGGRFPADGRRGPPRNPCHSRRLHPEDLLRPGPGRFPLAPRGAPYVAHRGQRGPKVRPSGRDTERSLLSFLLRELLDRKPPKTRLPGELLAAVPRATASTVSAETGIPPESLKEIADRLAAAKRPLVIAGGVGTAQAGGLEIASSAALIQWVTGAIPERVDFARSENYRAVGTLRDMEELSARMGRGEAGVVFLFRTNPVFSLPPRLAFKENLKKAGLTVGMGEFLDETVREADLVLPLSHSLESWGDVEPRRGVVSLLQPVLPPLHDTLSDGDALLGLLGTASGSGSAGGYRDLLAAAWEKRLGEAGRNRLLEKGYVEETLPKKSGLPRREKGRLRPPGRRAGGGCRETRPRPGPLPADLRRAEPDPADPFRDPRPAHHDHVRPLDLRVRGDGAALRTPGPGRGDGSVGRLEGGAAGEGPAGPPRRGLRRLPRRGPRPPGPDGSAHGRTGGHHRRRRDHEDREDGSRSPSSRAPSPSRDAASSPTRCTWRRGAAINGGPCTPSTNTRSTGGRWPWTLTGATAAPPAWRPATWRTTSPWRERRTT